MQTAGIDRLSALHMAVELVQRRHDLTFRCLWGCGEPDAA